MSSCHKIMKPFTCNSAISKFVQKNTMVDLIKGFGKIKVDNIHTFAIFEILKNVFAVLKQLWQTWASSSKIMLTFVENIVAF